MPPRAMRAALMALMAAMALRSMQGIWTRPAIGSQVRPRLCSMPISAAFPPGGEFPQVLRKSGGGHGAGYAHFSLAAYVRAGNGGVFLYRMAIPPAVSRKRCTASGYGETQNLVA